MEDIDVRSEGGCGFEYLATYGGPGRKGLFFFAL